MPERVGKVPLKVAGRPIRVKLCAINYRIVLPNLQPVRTH